MGSPLLLLLLHLLYMFVGQPSAAAAQEALFQASKCSNTSECSRDNTWNLRLPVWQQLLLNSTIVQVCLTQRSGLQCHWAEHPTVSWADHGSGPQPLVQNQCVSMDAKNATIPPVLMTRGWSCQKNSQYQSTVLTLSGSGFEQEVSLFMRKTGGCQIVEVISRHAGLNGTLLSLVFALSPPPQRTRMSLKFEEQRLDDAKQTIRTVSLTINSLNKTGHYIRSEDAEQITISNKELSMLLTKQLGMNSVLNYRDGTIQIACHPGSSCECKGIGTEIRLSLTQQQTSPAGQKRSWPVIWVALPSAVILLLVIAAFTRSTASLAPSTEILIVSLEAEVAALCCRLARLPTREAQVSLLQGHQINLGLLRRALQHHSSRTVRTYLLAGAQTMLIAEDLRPPALGIGLDVWRAESSRFSLLLYQPPEAEAAAAVRVERPMLNELGQILGQAEGLEGTMRWAVIGDCEAAAAYLRDDLHLLEDDAESEEDLPQV